MANGAVDVDGNVDRSYDADDPETAFRDFLAGETCKPVFRFGGA